MRKFKEQVDNKEKILIVVEKNSNKILFQTNESPLANFIKKIFFKEINLNTKIEIYANQLGIGLAELSNILKIEYYYGTEISAPAKDIINVKNIEYEYKKLVELIHSSKCETMICPIEKKISEIKTTTERLKFLEEISTLNKVVCKVKKV